MVDFPLWLRIAHFLNIILITLLIRSGIEILSAHPKLYTGENAVDGSEWIRFTRKKMPKDRLWTSTDEEESFSSLIALPGRSNLGLGRHWHFFNIIFWVANGAAYWTLLFATGEWARLIPTSWDIFPRAWGTAMTYASGHFPPPGEPYNPLQQLTYAAVVFILGPFVGATGAAMSPAVGAAFPWYPKIFRGRQTARSLHFLGLVAFILYIIGHITLVVLERFPLNMSNIVFGTSEGATFELALILFGLFVVAVIAVHAWATQYSLLRPRRVQNMLDAVIAPIRSTILGWTVSVQNFPRSMIAPYFRVNGHPPETEEYKEMLKQGFTEWRLRVYGLVKNQQEFSLDDLRAMPRQTQVTEHSCIQGWTAIGEWGGARVSDILNRCHPLSNARYAVFHSLARGERDEYGHGDPNREYYEVIDLRLAEQDHTIVAYEMNGRALPVTHGAPARLRVETQLGYKMVKWLRSIELIDDYRSIGNGQGGYREDVLHYSIDASI